MPAPTTIAVDHDADHDLDHDGDPVSTRAPGEPMPGGVLAWERLGVGHRCETWLAWSPTRWCPVVVKLPRPHQIDHPRARRSLAREVAALAGNQHPALARLYEDGTTAPVPYVVFEHVDGIALDDEIDANGPLSAGEAAALGGQVLAAVRTVNARGLVHVDLKPENVMLRDGRPVLLDFGSARAIGAGQPSGTLIGSAGYAAPELEAGAPIHPAMDLYGLGVIMYEALTGTPAFDPDLFAGDRPRPADPIGSTPSALGALVLTLLDPEPTARPGVDDTLQALDEFAADAGLGARPDWLRG